MPDLRLTWADYPGGYGTQVTGPQTIDTGGVNVTVDINDEIASSVSFALNLPTFDDPGDDLPPDSQLKLLGDSGTAGLNDTSTTTLTFTSADAAFEDGVTDLSFRIDDIDAGAANDVDASTMGLDPHIDIVNVRAFDVLGNEIPVTITAGGGMSQAGQTLTGTTQGLATDGAQSALFEIAGPVGRVEIDYDNGDVGSHEVLVSDLLFTTIDVDPLNDPTAVDDTASTDVDTLIEDINVLGNDTDPNGDPLTVTDAFAPSGTVTINGDGTLDYLPDPGFIGEDTISYEISDGAGGTDIAQVIVTVSPGLNDLPIANDDAASGVSEALIANIDILGNDSDPDGDPLTVTSATAPSGTVTINPDGTLNYTSDVGFVGEDTITYVIDDGISGTATAEVIVTVTAPGGNSAPIANDDGPIAAETGVLLDDIFVIGNDSDPDGDPFTVTGAVAANGTVTVNPDGTLNYTSDIGFTGQDTITYTIDDAISGTDTADVIVNVTGTPNDPPVANDDTGATPEDTLLEDIDILGNDSDPEGDPLTVTSATAPNGTVTINGDGTLDYLPDPGFNGVDTITYVIDDGNSNTDTGSVVITVGTPNDPPVANDDAGTTPVDTLLEDIDILGNDTDPEGDPLTVTSATAPNGTVTINGDGTLDYQPDPGFSGPDTITYVIDDGNGNTDTGSVAINVFVPGPNDPPVALNDAVDASTDVTLEDIDVLGNDSDPNGDPLTVTSATSANGGIVTINPDGTLDYTSPLGFEGTDLVTYTIDDGNGGTDTGILRVSVRDDAPGNQAPTANDDTASTPEDTLLEDIDILGNDSDPEGDPLTVTSATAPNGTVTINGDGTLDYLPDPGFSGPDTITYVIDDGNGNTDTGSVAVTVGVVTNDPPVAVDDATQTTPEDTLLEDINVLGNDSDPDGDPLTVTTATAPNGTVTINGDGTLDYQPDLGFTGTDTITYTITDSISGTDTATVPVIVGTPPPNDDPIALNDAVDASTDVLLEDIDVLGNDSDPNGDPLTVTAATSDNGGTVVINPDGTLDYTSPLGFEGTDLIRYTIDDGNGGTDEGIVRVSVRDDAPGNQAPTANDDTASTPEDTLLEDIDILGNDSDPEGDPLTVTSATAPNGTVTINGDGTLDYLPDPGFSGPDTITYVIDDGNGNTDTGSVAITVGTNDPPVANDDALVTTTVDTAVLAIDVLGNDSDPDGDALTVTGATALNGTVIVNGDNTLSYTPDPGFSGDDTITYAITDSISGTDTAIVPVSVTVPGAPDGIVDGTPGDDTIDLAYLGDPEGDSIDAGDEILPGEGPNDDIVEAGAGNDSIDTFFGDDDVRAGSGDDTVNTGLGDDEVIGEEGADEITTEDGSDTVDGGIGDDIIDTSGTAPEVDDPLFPTDPFDATPDDDRDSVLGGEGNDSITTGDDADTIDAGIGDDTVIAGIDDDSVDGGAGLDSLLGGQGADTIEGGAGDDTIIGGNFGLSDYDGDDLNFPVTVSGTVFNSDPNINDDRDSLVGGDGNDSIFGGDDADTILGGADNDTIDGGIDDDSIEGNDGDDSIIGDHGSDSILGGAGDDFIDASSSTLLFEGEPDATEPAGLEFNDRDVVEGGDGNDTILGGDDQDILEGGADDDSIDGGIDDDQLDGGAGNDFVEGGEGDDDIAGDTGDDTLLGDEGDDLILGEDGADSIEGGDGDDSIEGGADSDTVTGGEGADTIDTGDDRDLILGATAGDSVDGGEGGDDFDTLDLTTATADQLGLGGSLTVNITSLDGEDGTVEFRDSFGAITDTMTFENIENIIGTDNSDPVAIDDFAETPVDTLIEDIDIIGNDFDTDGDTVSLVPGSTSSADGTVTENPDGTVDFLPNPGFEGPATVTYTVTDGSGGTDVGTLTINVVGNQPPEPNNDIASTPVDTLLEDIDVLGNDSDPDSDPLTVTSATAPNGVVTINPDGTLDYDPAPGFEGTDIITYVVDDGNGNTAPAEVIVTVGTAPSNAPPTAVDDPQETTPINTLLEDINVLGNDSDPDGDPLEVIDAIAPNGTVTINPDGTLDYQPDPGFEGEDTITYQITDNISGNDTAELTVIVGTPNTDPDADPDTTSTLPGTPVTVFPLGNDTDPEGDPLTIISASAPDGTAVVSPDGTSVTYTPDPGFVDDVDTITYTISDGNGGTDTTTIQVLVGTPPLDGIVQGTGAGEFIGEDDPTTVPVDPYLGDPDGDQVDNSDAIAPEAGADDDVILAGGGNDTIEAGEGNDFVEGEEGDDIIDAGEGDDTVLGGDGSDSIDTGDGNDSVLADDGGSLGFGNDTITTGDGSDTVGGGLGDDVIDTSSTTPFPLIDDSPLPSIPEDSDPNDDKDFVDGDDGDDSITTGDDDDTIIGGEGNDTINSGIDDDSVIGDGGDDLINDVQGADFIDGGNGNDTINAGTDFFTDYVGDDPNLPITDSGITFVTDPSQDDGKDTVFGGAGDDLIFTGDDADSIDGGDDNDTIFAGIDDDTVRGGDGDDSIEGGHGADTIAGGDGNDYIDAGHTSTVTLFEDEPDATEPVGLELNDRDVVTGGAGDDTIIGGDDDDSLSGGNGQDSIDGGIDEDTIDGQNGNDTLEGGAGDDSILGGAGTDSITGDEGSDTIDGGTGNDTITGGDDADSIFGGAGEDSIIGATAGDTIDGGEGPVDFDVLDLTGAGAAENVGGRVTVTYDAPGSEGGVVNFLDAGDVVTGTARFDNIENVIPCFTPGTMIATPTGERAVEDLKVGDRVITRDNGIQEIRWAGAKELSGAQLAANDHLQPVLIQAGALGDNLPERDILVSPQHRMLLTTDQATMYFEEREVLVAAKHLTMLDGVDRVESSGTTYIHIMFDQHEVVLSNGTWSESFQPGDYSLDGIGKEQRDEILELFPELATQVGSDAYQSARRTLKKYEAALLLG